MYVSCSDLETLDTFVGNDFEGIEGVADIVYAGGKPEVVDEVKTRKSVLE